MAQWVVLLTLVLSSTSVYGAKKSTSFHNISVEHEPNCTASSVHHFPSLPLTGGPISSTIITLVAVVYIFVFLIRVCDLHFVSCIKTMGRAINLSSDVAGASLMAATVSCPDLFINLIGTFVTQGDIGLGTIVGCGIFNTLAVPALCILISPAKTVRLNGWALTRDTFFYSAALITLAVSLIDNKIEWFEAMAFVLMYILYIGVLSVNTWLRTKVEFAINTIRKRSTTERAPLLLKSQSILSYGMDEEANEFERDQSLGSRITSFLTFPIDLILELTVPKPTDELLGVKLYPLTFIMCLGWIAASSYVIAWFITVTGFELKIPDSLVGLTFIAIGMSVPQAASSIIIAKQGDGAMALSNSLGSNVFDTLICLGLPWLLKSVLYESHSVVISSKSIGYSSIILVTSLGFMYICVAVNKFRLNSTVGYLFITVYIAFAALSALLEMNVFFVSNLPFCL